jgi:hypothetical protein
MKQAQYGNTMRLLAVFLFLFCKISPLGDKKKWACNFYKGWCNKKKQWNKITLCHVSGQQEVPSTLQCAQQDKNLTKLQNL